MRRILVLIGITVLVWAALGIPASFLPDGPPLLLTGVAAGVCLFPAMLTLILMDQVRNCPPEQQLLIFMVSVFARMGLTVGDGLAAYYLIPLVSQNQLPFVLWGLAFYLVTLAAETTLVYSQVRNSTPPASRNGP